MVIVKPGAEIGLGREIIPFLKGIGQHVDEGIHQKQPQKHGGRKQVQPALPIVLFHIPSESAEINPRAGFLVEQEYLIGL